MRRKRNILSESMLNNIIQESIRTILTEDKEGKNMSKARNIVRQINPNINAQEFITAVRNDIPNSRLEQCKYLPGVTYLALNNEINSENRVQFNNTLALISKAHSNEYDSMLNNMAVNDLIKRFATESANEFQKEKDEINKEQFIDKGEYTIVRITSAQEAARYGKYTTWCITSSDPANGFDDGYDDEEEITTVGQEMYDNYTNFGEGVFYFCLKNGFENIPKTKGINCPLDEYGLSMIATSVDSFGKCQTITCRWNHDNGGNDNVMSPMELSRIIGKNYYDVFKPYTIEELHSKGIIGKAEVADLLSKGEKVFDRIYTTNLPDIKCGELRGEDILFNEKEKRLIGNEWCRAIFGNSHEGIFQIIDKYGKANFLTLDGRLLLSNDIPRNDVTNFNNGIACIINTVNYETQEVSIINKEGKFITKTPIKIPSINKREINVFSNFIFNANSIFDFNGNIVGSYKFVNFADDDKDYLLVQNSDSKFGLLDKNLNLFNNSFYDYIGKSKYGIACRDNGKTMLYKHNGELLGGRTFDSIEIKSDKIIVTIGDKMNFIDYDTDKYLLPEWFDNYIQVWGNYAIVWKDNKSALMDLTKLKVIHGWFDSLTFQSEFGHRIFINNTNQYISDRDLQIHTYDDYDRQEDEALRQERIYDKIGF